MCSDASNAYVDSLVGLLMPIPPNLTGSANSSCSILEET